MTAAKPREENPKGIPSSSSRLERSEYLGKHDKFPDLTPESLVCCKYWLYNGSPFPNFSANRLNRCFLAPEGCLRRFLNADRLKSLLRSLILTGLQDFDDSVDCVISESMCACGSQSVTEIEPYRKYHIGTASCRDLRGRCGIRQFLACQTLNLKRIQSLLQAVPSSQKSPEIDKIEQTLLELISPQSSPEDMDLCKTVGDLIIALESCGIPEFYTQNIKESQHLCRALAQTLRYRSNHPDEQDAVYEKSAPHWPVV